MRTLIQISLLICLLGCTTKGSKIKAQLKDDPTSLSYLALGDSYTIGESVAEELRWPVQLAKKLSDSGTPVDPPRIIATTGWTTDELQSAIAQAGVESTYDLVSLLIGVNNQYREYPFEQYEKEFSELLETAIEISGNRQNRVFVVSIPDYGVTPFGQKKEPAKIAVELDRYNAKAKEISEDRGVIFINITDISKNALNDSSLVADDQLHPSGKMYTQWVERIFPALRALLE